jgi:hypothetical protein
MRSWGRQIGHVLRHRSAGHEAECGNRSEENVFHCLSPDCIRLRRRECLDRKRLAKNGITAQRKLAPKHQNENPKAIAFPIEPDSGMSGDDLPLPIELVSSDWAPTA